MNFLLKTERTPATEEKKTRRGEKKARFKNEINFSRHYTNGDETKTKERIYYTT